MALIHGKDFIDGDNYYGDLQHHTEFIEQLKSELRLKLESKLLKKIIIH